MFNDSFLSIVKKDCPEDSLLVRARRPGDIEKVFGRRTKVTRTTDADYLYRAVVPRDEVVRAMEREVLRVDYGNFKDSVADKDLHDAYMRVWTAMAQVQDPRPYSEPFRRPSLTLKTQTHGDLQVGFLDREGHLTTEGKKHFQEENKELTPAQVKRRRK
jgi:hypothetical protein